LGRAGARTLVVSVRRWAAATKAAAREQLFATSAALEVSDAALSGEALRDLAHRIVRLARGLSGAQDALVFARSAGAFGPLEPREVDPALAALAERAFTRATAEELTREGGPRALALPLRAGGVAAGVLVLCAPPGKRLRHRGLAPLLHRAGAALVAAERQASKNRFLSFAAHELKTPLTTIKGYAYSLARRMERGEATDPRAIEVLERQAEKLHGLLEEMLEVSRLETGRFVLHDEACDLGELLDSALRALRRLGGEASSAAPPAQALPLRADRDRIERALLALLLGARAFGPVSARVERLDGKAVARIAWEGPSLSGEARARAFAARWEATTPERQGLGMALAVAERVAQLHGGALRCEARAFVLEVPLREAPREVHPAGTARRVLVVDDDEAIATMLAGFLGENGFVAESATGGRDALARMVVGPPPDLLVLDLRMPELDGRALLREARARGLRPRTVLLSADREVAQAAAELGAEAFVEKPFAPDGLLAAVRRALPLQPALQGPD
jgi:signal transduction histidine kinase/ActR/RegA family two-component response regulator